GYAPRGETRFHGSVALPRDRPRVVLRSMADRVARQLPLSLTVRPSVPARAPAPPLAPTPPSLARGARGPQQRCRAGAPRGVCDGAEARDKRAPSGSDRGERLGKGLGHARV